MLKLLLTLFQIVASASDLISFASEFNIELDENCANVNQVLKTLNTLRRNCDLSESSKFLGCIKNSVSYLTENLLNLQKCLDQKSFFELASLLHNFENEQTCIIFHTTIYLNENLKSDSSKMINKAIVFEKKIEQKFDESCSIQSLKIGTKISKFLSNLLGPAKLSEIVEYWSKFFNNPESIPYTSLDIDLISENSFKTEENQEIILNFDNNDINGTSKKKKSDVESTFWEELYCALIKITYDSGEVKKFLARYYSQDIVKNYDCSKFKYDLNTIQMKISWLISEKKKAFIDNFKWAIGLLPSFELDYSFSGFVKKIGDLLKNGVYYYAKRGFQIPSDIIKSVYEMLFGKL